MPKNKKIRFLLRGLPVVIILIASASLLYSGDGLSIKELVKIENMLAIIPDNPVLCFLFLICLFAAKSLSIIMPLTALYIIVGCVYPPPAALVCGMAGVIVCMTISYWIGYFSSVEYMDSLMLKHPKLDKFVGLQRDKGWYVSFFLRLCCLPFDVVSMYLGSLKIPFHLYLISGLAGTMPMIIFGTLIGIGITDPASPLFILSIAVTVVLTLISIPALYMLGRNNDPVEEINK